MRDATWIGGAGIFLGVILACWCYWFFFGHEGIPQGSLRAQLFANVAMGAILGGMNGMFLWVYNRRQGISRPLWKWLTSAIVLSGLGGAFLAYLPILIGGIFFGGAYAGSIDMLLLACAFGGSLGIVHGAGSAIVGWLLQRTPIGSQN